MTTLEVPGIRIRPADAPDSPVLQRLWAMFSHDMSTFTSALPDPAGRFRQERLEAALAHKGWAAHLVHLGQAPIGFALVRALEQDERVLSSFFVVRGARRAGHGLAAALAVTACHPGSWAVAFQDSNAAAAGFWPQVAARCSGRDWSTQHLAVPERPDLPPDTWIRFRRRLLAE